MRPEAHGCAHEPSSYLHKLWFDTVVHDARSLRALLEVAGESQVLLGSDFPFDMGLDDPVAWVRAAGLDDAVTERIVGVNAAGTPSRRSTRVRIARWRGNYGPGEGFVIDDRVVPFADGLTVADVLAVDSSCPLAGRIDLRARG